MELFVPLCQLFCFVLFRLFLILQPLDFVTLCTFILMCMQLVKGLPPVTSSAARPRKRFFDFWQFAVAYGFATQSGMQ